MKIYKAALGAIAAASLLAGTSAFGGFSGYFSGYYAPGNWASPVYNNPLYDTTAFVYSGSAPASVQIDGAVDANQQVSQEQPPASIIDYTIVLNGTGTQPVAFKYLFFRENGPAGLDAAALIYDGAVVASLDTLVGTVQTYVNNNTFQGGHTIGFRVYSDNDNFADYLQISAVPEPSTLTFMGLGVSALLWKLRRRQS